MAEHSRPTPCSPKLPLASTIDLSTPRPSRHLPAAHAPRSGSQPAPSSLGLSPVTPSNHWVSPRNEESSSLHLLPQGLAPAPTLTLVQHKSLGSWNVFLTLFASVTDGPSVDIVLLQDPPYSKGFLTIFSGYKSFGPPVPRPRVAC